MKNQRKGNDLNVMWRLLHEGEPFRLEGRDITIYLKDSFGKTEVKDFRVSDNTIFWTFYGKDQKHNGRYSLELIINEGEKGMITTDVCDFVNLVPHSCMVGGSDSPNVETESIELTSTLEYVAGGGSYDDTALWKELEKKVDKEEGLGLSEENYTTEEKEKLEGLKNYDDSGIKVELAKKAEKSDIPTKLSDLEQDIEIGSDYDDTELRDMIALRNVGAEDTDESVEEPEIGGGGASSDKQGVVSQTLTYNSADNTYSVSNVVRGSIPSFFIDLVTEAGASFNAESGYFSLNGIDNIAYDEMRQIYNCRTGYGVNSLLAVYGKTYTARTNFAAFRGFSQSFSNHQPTTIYTKYLCYRNASMTKFVIHNEGVPLYVRADCVNNFGGMGIGGAPMERSRLEEIIGIIDVTNLTNANFFHTGTYQPWLTTFYLKSLKSSIDLSGMPRLSEATILYMINNENAASAITIKLHADAKAMADASEAIQSALANHANITLGV